VSGFREAFTLQFVVNIPDSSLPNSIRFTSDQTSPSRPTAYIQHLMSSWTDNSEAILQPRPSPTNAIGMADIAVPTAANYYHRRIHCPSHVVVWRPPWIWSCFTPPQTLAQILMRLSIERARCEKCHINCKPLEGIPKIALSACSE
jgi:hypothetical protein